MREWPKWREGPGRVTTRITRLSSPPVTDLEHSTPLRRPGCFLSKWDAVRILRRQYKSEHQRIKFESDDRGDLGSPTRAQDPFSLSSLMDRQRRMGTHERGNRS